MNPTFSSTVAAMLILLVMGINASAEERRGQQELGYYIKIGDIKGEYRSDASIEEVQVEDLMWEMQFLIWEAEADDFYWRDGKKFRDDDKDTMIWGEESGDF